MRRSAICFLGIFLPAIAGWSSSAAANEVSICGVEDLTGKQLEKVTSAFAKKDPQQVVEVVGDIEKRCRPRVSKDIWKNDDFRRFMYAETVEFSFRQLLLRRGYDMDAVDHRLNMQCNFADFAAQYPEGEFNPRGSKLLDGAEVDADQHGRRIQGDDKLYLKLYVVAQAHRWQKGPSLGILPACQVSN